MNSAGARDFLVFCLSLFLCATFPDSFLDNAIILNLFFTLMHRGLFKCGGALIGCFTAFMNCSMCECPNRRTRKNRPFTICSPAFGGRGFYVIGEIVSGRIFKSCSQRSSLVFLILTICVLLGVLILIQPCF